MCARKAKAKVPRSPPTGDRGGRGIPEGGPRLRREDNKAEGSAGKERKIRARVRGRLRNCLLLKVNLNFTFSTNYDVVGLT